MNHPEEEKRLYHPCKDTCSGYKQGYEDGQLDVRTSAEWKFMEDRLAYAERLLREIDILCSPDRRSHVKRNAIENIQDIVMTRKYQELDRIRNGGE